MIVNSCKVKFGLLKPQPQAFNLGEKICHPDTFFKFQKVFLIFHICHGVKISVKVFVFNLGNHFVIFILHELKNAFQVCIQLVCLTAVLRSLSSVYNDALWGVVGVHT